VRGTARDATAPAPRTPPAAPPAETPERAAVVPARRRAVAGGEAPAEPVGRPEPATVAGAGEPTEPSAALLAELQQLLVEAHERVRGAGAFPWARLQSLVDRATVSLLASPDLFWVAHHPAAPAGMDHLAFQQARACVLALRVGADLGYDRERLGRLGLAAALFDVGLWELSPPLLERVESLSGHDLAQYRAHARLSADIVERWAPPDVRILDSILDHHERERGQGFPRGIQGGAIDADAKIIGLVDTYTTLTAPAVARARLRPHEAIRDIVKTRSDQFPPLLVKALLSEISVFPPGTVVRLNTEEVGRVVAVNRHHPLRPRVEVFADGKGQRLGAPKLVDLADAPFVYITGPVGDDAR
jgi:hypothetical protein